MECSIRYVRFGEGDTLGAERPVLGFRGKDKAYCVVNDVDRIHVITVPVKDFDKSFPTMYHGEPYPITRYLHEIEQYKKRKPISPKADHIVSLAYAGKPEAIDEDSLAKLSDDLEALSNALDLSKPRPDTPTAPPKASPPEKKPGKAKIPPAPVSAPPAKPKAAVKSPPKRGRGRPKGSAGGLIATIAAELGTFGIPLRRACRAAGMKAPYTDEKAIKAAWKKHGK